ncbi:MAG TPA: hypothetical protein VMB83_03575 [Roseiarcus sp.]|nr:hypothetical protein [Roseiarcus sp.]
MMLACESGAATTELEYGASEPPTATRIVSGRDRADQTRGSSLAALAGMPISSRFCSWVGSSGRRYVFSIYPASECPAFRDAVLLAAVRDMTGERRAVLVRETGAFPEPVVARAQRELKAFGSGLELHLHLLATSAAERGAMIADLAIAPDGQGALY